MRYHRPVNVAAWVNGARRSARLTQRELADRSGVPQPTIARIESGKQMPRADTLDRLLRACGWELDMSPRRGQGEDLSLIRSWLSLSTPERARRGAESGRALGRIRSARDGAA